jgi:hypothetical protein
MKLISMGSQRRLRIQLGSPSAGSRLGGSCSVAELYYPKRLSIYRPLGEVLQKWPMHAPPLDQSRRVCEVRTSAFLPLGSNMVSVKSDRPQRRLTGTALRPCTLVLLSLRLPRDHSHTLSHYSHTLSN